MSKRMKVIVSVLIAVILLTIGGTASMVMAQEDEEPVTVPPVGHVAVLARVAEIMGIPEEDLADAFDLARQEVRAGISEETLDNWLERAVAEGLITPEEAGEIRDWWQDRPEYMEPGMMPRAFGFNKATRGGPMLGNRGEVQPQFKHRLQQGISRQFGRVMRQRVGTMDGEYQRSGPPWSTD